MDDEALELMRQQDRRRAQAGRSFVNERSVEEMAQEIEDRHRMSRTSADRRLGSQRRASPVGGGSKGGKAASASVARRHQSVLDDGPGGPEATNAVSQQSLVPSVSDPSLWMISCSQYTVMQLFLFRIATTPQSALTPLESGWASTEVRARPDSVAIAIFKRTSIHLYIWERHHSLLQT